MNRKAYLVLAAASLISGASASAAFVAGNLVVDRLGDGTQTLANTGNTQIIDQYTPTGTLVNSTSIPDSGASSLITSGTATSEGELSRSADGSALVLVGYNTNRPAASSVSGTSTSGGSAVLRAVGSLDSLGNFTLQATTTSFSANNIRTATANGSNFYAGGANSGTVLLPAGSSGIAGTAVQTTNANTRVNNIFNGNLYYSLSSTTAGVSGIYGFTGIPSASATPTEIITAGGGTGTVSPYDFAFNSSGTVAYVADDRAVSAGGGIQRYDLVGGVFTLTYTLGTGASSTVGARGLAVDFSGANPIVYATTAEATADRLISITDTGAASAATTLATAGTNEIFRGLDFAPVAVSAPEPTTVGLIGLVAMLGLRRRHA
jgi:hypothetical protein